MSCYAFISEIFFLHQLSASGYDADGEASPSPPLLDSTPNTPSSSFSGAAADGDDETHDTDEVCSPLSPDTQVGLYW